MGLKARGMLRQRSLLLRVIGQFGITCSQEGLMLTLHRHRRSVALTLLVVAIAVAGIGFMSIQDSRPQRASAASGGAEMILTLPSHDTCDDPDQPTICTLATGTTFTVSADYSNPSAEGYIHAQAWIDYDSQGLVHKKNTQATWADCAEAVFLPSQNEGFNGASGSCLTSLLPPQPASFYQGSMYTFQLTCTDIPSTSVIELRPSGDPEAGTSGTILHRVDGSHIFPKLSPLTIECLGLPEPGDTDGDGCSDQQEFGNDERMGGQRDYLNPWDYYDVVGPAGGPPDGRIDLPNDILGVLLHFSPSGAPPYDVQFDRGHRDGKTLWSMTAPDGVIDLPVDVLGVIYQFGHNCS